MGSGTSWFENLTDASCAPGHPPPPPDPSPFFSSGLGRPIAVGRGRNWAGAERTMLELCELGMSPEHWEQQKHSQPQQKEYFPQSIGHHYPPSDP